MAANDIVFPGWYDDPTNPGHERWWDGRAWTERVRIKPPSLSPPSVPAATPTQDGQNARLLRIVAGVGHLAAILGALLPWATLTSIFGTIDVSGMNGDGQIVFVSGLVGLLAIAIAVIADSNAATTVSVIAGAMSLFVSGYDTLNVAELAGEDVDVAVIQVGAGLWIALAGGVVAVAGSLGSTVVQRRP